MNKHQIKQFLHSFWHDDENSHERNSTMHRKELFFGAHSLVTTSLADPDLNRIWGTDVSHWDGNVNLSVTKSKGASFVFIKGLDGTLQAKYFVENRTRAIQAGLYQAPYQWLYKAVNVSPVAQAQAMKNLLDKYPSDLPPVIDFEWTYWAGSQSNPNWTDLDLYVTELLRLGVRKPILYTASGYANKFGQIPNTLKAKFSAFWFANYGVAIPSLPYGFTAWDFWQFASSGDASVYSPNDVNKKEVDLNYCVSLERLNELAGKATGEPMKYKGTVITAGLRVRSTPDSISTANVIGGLVNGDVLEADSVISGWWHIITKNGVAYSGYAYEGDAKGYIRTDVIVADPVPSIFITHDFSDVIVYNGKRYTANYVANNVEYKPEA